MKKVKTLDTTKASQQSNIPTKTLKQNSDYFAEYFNKNINQCISKSIFPSDLKLAYVTPVYNIQHCLITLIKKWKKSVDNGGDFGALLTDLQKAFNYLPHELLKKVFKKDVYNAKIKNIEDKIPDNLATDASLNAKINEVKGEIPNITNLASTTAFTAVENKIPSVTNLFSAEILI